jgi:Domain of unknown function (DUF4410)
MTSRLLGGVVLLCCAAALAHAEGLGLTGDVKVQDQPVPGSQVPGSKVPAPTAIYVGQFTADADAVKAPGGLFAEAEGLVQDRPRLLGGGGLLGGEGPLARRRAEDTPTPASVTDELESAIAAGLQRQSVAVPVGELGPGMAPPPGAWVISGRIVSVDPGNRLERAAVGFGTGQATAQVDVSVDAVDGAKRTWVIRMDGDVDSGKMPGGAVTLNPYVIAAKFVIGRKATRRDLDKLGGAIAKQVAAKARDASSH